jgi:hypothetical protein
MPELNVESQNNFKNLEVTIHRIRCDRSLKIERCGIFRGFLLIDNTWRIMYRRN